MRRPTPSIAGHRTVNTASGREVSLTCPVCGNEEFLSSGPEDEELRKGFRHVIMGVTGSDATLFQPVRFFACADCGYILKFLLPSEKEGEAGP
jgi:hypothetical protein